MGRIKRHFRLRFNEDKDNEADLNAGDELRCFFHEPKGLGLAQDVKHAGNLGGFFQRAEDRGDEQAEISGTLVFVGPDPEKSYRELMERLMNADRAELGYRPGKTFGGEEKTEYWRRVDLLSVEKTERERNGWLRCPVKLAAMTPWYNDEDVPMTVAQNKTKPFVVGVSLIGSTTDLLSVGNVTGMTGTIAPAGDLPASLWVRVYEAEQIANPRITVTGEDGTEYGQCALKRYTLPAGAELFMSTAPFDAYIRAGDTDLMSYADLNHDPFPRLPTGQTSTITLSADGEKIEQAEMDVLVRQYYRTV